MVVMVGGDRMFELCILLHGWNRQIDKMAFEMHFLAAAIVTAFAAR